jgi:hypothetical protein
MDGSTPATRPTRLSAARYGNADPASVNRPLAQRMAGECLAEMGPLRAAFARGPIQGAIDRAFPR